MLQILEAVEQVRQRRQRGLVVTISKSAGGGVCARVGVLHSNVTVQYACHHGDACTAVVAGLLGGKGVSCEL
jgi:hypothetical protein